MVVPFQFEDGMIVNIKSYLKQTLHQSFCLFVFRDMQKEEAGRIFLSKSMQRKISFFPDCMTI